MQHVGLQKELTELREQRTTSEPRSAVFTSALIHREEFCLFKAHRPKKPEYFSNKLETLNHSRKYLSSNEREDVHLAGVGVFH